MSIEFSYSGKIVRKDSFDVLDARIFVHYVTYLLSHKQLIQLISNGESSNQCQIRMLFLYFSFKILTSRVSSEDLNIHTLLLEQKGSTPSFFTCLISCVSKPTF